MGSTSNALLVGFQSSSKYLSSLSLQLPSVECLTFSIMLKSYLGRVSSAYKCKSKKNIIVAIHFVSITRQRWILRAAKAEALTEVKELTFPATKSAAEARNPRRGKV